MERIVYTPYGQAHVFYVPVVSQADVKLFKTGMTIAAGDAKIRTRSQAFANLTAEYLAFTSGSVAPSIGDALTGKVGTCVSTDDAGTYTSGAIKVTVNSVLYTQAYDTDKDTTLTALAAQVQAGSGVLTCTYNAGAHTITTVMDADVSPTHTWDITSVVGTMAAIVPVNTGAEHGHVVGFFLTSGTWGAGTAAGGLFLEDVSGVLIAGDLTNTTTAATNVMTISGDCTVALMADAGQGFVAVPVTSVEMSTVDGCIALIDAAGAEWCNTSIEFQTIDSALAASLATSAELATLDGVVDAGFTAGAKDAGVTLADGAHGGTAAVLTLKRVVVVNTTNAQTAVDISASGTGNAHALNILATGGGKGVAIGAASVGLSVDSSAADAIAIQGGTASDGVQIAGEGVGLAIKAANVPTALAADGSIKASIEAVKGTALGAETVGGYDAAALHKLLNIVSPTLTCGVTAQAGAEAALAARSGADGFIKAGLWGAMGTALTETAGQIAAAITKFFNKGTPTGTINSLPDAVAGAASGVAIVGSLMTPSAATIAAAVWTLTDGIETGLTPKNAMRDALAILLGEVTGGASATPLFKSVDIVDGAVLSTKTRVTGVAVDASGNRGKPTLDHS